MKFLIPIAGLLLGLIMSSCSPRVATSRPTQADLSKYRTFAYLPNADVQMERAEDAERVNSYIIDNVNTEMKNQGYRIDRDNPDLLVLISTRTATETRAERDPVYANTTYATYPYATYGRRTVSPYYNNYYYNGFYDYSGVVGYDTDYYKVKVGTLVITLIDRKTGNTVWRGRTSDAVTAATTVDEMISLVDNIFEAYPLSKSAR